MGTFTMAAEATGTFTVADNGDVTMGTFAVVLPWNGLGTLRVLR